MLTLFRGRRFQRRCDSAESSAAGLIGAYSKIEPRRHDEHNESFRQDLQDRQDIDPDDRQTVLRILSIL